jgi:hypothetical protein
LQFQQEQLAIKLNSEKIDINLLKYPQLYIYLSEQGVPRDPNDSEGFEAQAKYICLAHNELHKFDSFTIGSAHNYLYSTENENSSNGCFSQGACYSLLSKDLVSIDLSNMETQPTGRAYLATSLNNWKKNDNHYCCKEHKLGCQTIKLNISLHKPIAILDSSSNDTYTMWAIDQDDLSIPTTIRIYDSNKKYIDFITNNLRKDINTIYFSTGFHGLSISKDRLSGLARGRITFYVIDHSGKEYYFGSSNL